MTPTFRELGVSRKLTAQLEARGISIPFPIQTAVIPDGLARRDVCGEAETGSGKTLAFAVPIVQRLTREELPGALVLVPTRELCQQVADEFDMLAKAHGLRVGVAYGGVPLRTQIERFRRGVDIIVATPGRLLDLMERMVVDLTDIEWVVLDEADRMLDMGFRPAVSRILRALPTQDRVTMLFSATLAGEVEEISKQFLSDPVRHTVARTAPTVESAEHHVFEVHAMDRLRVLEALLRGERGLSLVFCRTKRGAERVTHELRHDGFRVVGLHGDMRQEARLKAIERFTAGRADVLVATDVAARGLDIDGVTQVVNYDMPESFSTYVHRVGRTARAGRRGIGITLVLWDQLVEARRLARALELSADIPKVFSSDALLADLGGMAEPPAEAAEAAV